MRTKQPQSSDELERHLADHIGFLRSSADAYDRGEDGESKRLAVSLRVLCHDTRTSHSLLGQLGRLGASFLSTTFPHDPGNLTTHGGLVVVAADGASTRYVAMLDEVPYQRWMAFEDWWNEVVFVDDTKESLTRKQLVSAVANQDGGAHVDPGLDDTYARLARHNSLGWVVATGSGREPIPKAERAAIRQIAHETLRTLLPAYRKAPAEQAQFFFGGAAFHESRVEPPLHTVANVGRNDPCPCGSGRKWKKCHGDPTN